MTQFLLIPTLSPSLILVMLSLLSNCSFKSSILMTYMCLYEKYTNKWICRFCFLSDASFCLDQWFSTRMALPHPGWDICQLPVVTVAGCPKPPMTEIKDTAQHPTTHRTAYTMTRTDPAQNVTNANVKRSGLDRPRLPVHGCPHPALTLFEGRHGFTMSPFT